MYKDYDMIFNYVFILGRRRESSKTRLHKDPNPTGAPIRETGQFGSADARMRPGSQRNYRMYEV